jgi:hypothetical protein
MPRRAHILSSLLFLGAGVLGAPLAERTTCKDSAFFTFKSAPVQTPAFSLFALQRGQLYDKVSSVASFNKHGALIFGNKKAPDASSFALCNSKLVYYNSKGAKADSFYLCDVDSTHLGVFLSPPSGKTCSKAHLATILSKLTFAAGKAPAKEVPLLFPIDSVRKTHLIEKRCLTCSRRTHKASLRTRANFARGRRRLSSLSPSTPRLPHPLQSPSGWLSPPCSRTSGGTFENGMILVRDLSVN